MDSEQRGGLRDGDVVGAYVADRRLPDDGIPAEKLTHVYYAFADVEDGVLAEEGDEIDGLVALRERNPDLKVLVSVGGWNRCEEFPEMAATEANRRRFAESAVGYVREHDLDGVDYDWEFPDEEEAGDFTAMLRTLREELDEAGEEDGREYLLTSALSNRPEHLAGVELGVVHEYLDLVNAMTYDMQAGEGSHHTNLYTSPLNPRFSVAETVEDFFDAGVPREKLVVGSGFYSRGAERVGYETLVEEFVDRDGYEREWDDVAKAPYLSRGEEFVGYDDPESVRRKVDYLREEGLAGIMFWQYGHDAERNELLDAIYERMAETARGP
ncbi:MAG: glycoside hydrolase family 18 protein [Haloferacaceae archaeon]